MGIKKINKKVVDERKKWAIVAFVMTEHRRERLINIARSLIHLKNGRAFHVSFILKKNQLLVTGVNDYSQIHLAHKFGQYKPQKESSKNYVAGRHSEIVAMNIFINRFGHSNCCGLTLFNVRIGNDDLPCIAKPCKNCFPVMESFGFKEIIWTE